MEDHFFVVIANKDTRLIRHDSRESVETEAKRLAAENPHEKFFILRAERVAMVMNPTPPVVIENTNEDPIPF